jgi:hypothetical protein
MCRSAEITQIIAGIGWLNIVQVGQPIDDSPDNYT